MDLKSHDIPTRQGAKETESTRGEHSKNKQQEMMTEKQEKHNLNQLVAVRELGFRHAILSSLSYS